MARGDRELARAEGFQRGIEAEFAEERANALGRAGRRLDEALDERRTALAEAGGTLPPAVDELLLDAIAERLFALIVQRECVGLRHDNLAWIRAHYDVPDAALFRR